MSDERPISVVITRRVRPGCADEFERRLREFIPVALAFPGHLGVHVLRPAAGHDDWGVVLRFRSGRDWEAFRAWGTYADWTAGLRPLLALDPAVEEVCGLETWFTPPGARPPIPRWKMFLLTWTGVNLVAGVQRATISPALETLPFPLGFLLFNAGVVAALTWVVMPVFVRSAHGWLHPASPPSAPPGRSAP